MINTARIHATVEALFSAPTDITRTDAFNAAIAVHRELRHSHPLLVLNDVTYSVILVECAGDVCRCTSYIVIDNNIHREKKLHILLDQEYAKIFLTTLYSTLAEETNSSAH